MRGARWLATGRAISRGARGGRRMRALPRLPLPALLLLLLPALLLTASPGHAYFEQIESGARAVSLGRAFVAIADDPSAVYWNPAGLTQPDRSAVLVHYTKPFIVTGLNGTDLMAAHRWRDWSLGAGWHHLGVTGIISEDLWTFSVARPLGVAARLRRIAGFGAFQRLSAGGSLKLARVGFADLEDVAYGSETKLLFDIGILAQLSPRWRAAYVARNLGSPTFEFVDGGGGTELPFRQSAGIGFQWNPASLVTAAIAENHAGDAELRFGGEVVFYDVFALRSGFVGSEFSGGVGVRGRSWQLRGAFQTHGDLGMSFRAGLLIPLGHRRPAEAGS